MYGNFIFSNGEDISDGYVLRDYEEGVIFERRYKGKVTVIDIWKGTSLLDEETYKICREAAHKKANRGQTVYICL